MAAAAIAEDVHNVIRRDPSKPMRAIGAKFKVYEPWMDQVAAGLHYLFQQDGAPAHNSALTLKWLQENLQDVWEKEVWPPQLPKLLSFGLFCVGRF
jgi:hypothetical protein